MLVTISDYAKRDAKSPEAASALQLAGDMLNTEDWQKLLDTGDVEAFQGGNMEGVFEVKPPGYRAAFCLIQQAHAYIFACYKKPGGKLKRQQLRTIEKRAKRIFRELNKS